MELRFFVEPNEAKMRIDRLVAKRLGIVRVRARALVEAGEVRIQGERVAPDRRVRPGEEIEVSLGGGIAPIHFPIPILYEDEAVVVVNKPAGIPVHPVRGHPKVTVVGALLSRGPLGGGEPHRPGVVHRLDTDASGVLILARTEQAYQSLVEQFIQGKVRKEYLVLVEGEVEPKEGVIDGRVGPDARHPWRKRVTERGKEAYTEFSVLRHEGGRTLLLVRPRTGRTHQIRVHLSAIGHPVVGDPIYGTGQGNLMLHAWRLGVYHPVKGTWMEFVAPPPLELERWLRDSELRPKNLPPPPPKTALDPMG